MDELKSFIIEYWLTALFGVIAAIFAGLWRAAKKKLKQRHVEQEALQEGVLSLLRSELITSGEKAIREGEIKVYKKDAYSKLYKAYHELGGNGSITHIYNDVMDLPPIHTNLD